MPMPKLTQNGDGQFEVHPCHGLSNNMEAIDATKSGPYEMEACDSPECIAAIPHIWSVYEHQTTGGIQWVVDCADKSDADTIADILQKHYVSKE